MWTSFPSFFIVISNLERFLQVYQGTGLKIATDLSVVVACETLIDAVNLTDTDGPMNSPIDYTQEYDEECQDARCELRSDYMVESASIRKTIDVKNPTVQLRTFFPENWLFDIMESDDGIIER